MPEKILFIQTAFIGDLILSVPTFKYLRQKYPDAEISLFCRKGLGALPKSLGLIDQVYDWDKANKKSYNSIVVDLRNVGFNQVICPHPSFRSALLAKQTGAPVRIGFSRWWNKWAFTHRVVRPMSLPEAVRQLSLLRTVDETLSVKIGEYANKQTQRNRDILDRPGSADPLAAVPEWASLSCVDWFESQTMARAELLKRLRLDQGEQNERPWAAIAPGSVWGTKRYPLKSYHEVARKLVGMGYQVLALGAPNEKQDCEAVVYGLDATRVIAGGTSLVESAHLLYLCELLFTNDCGAMHLASLTETSTVSMFGPTALKFGYRPWQNDAVVVQNQDLKCRPCHHHGPPTCPLGTHECMTSLSPEKVLAARLNLMLKKRGRTL